MTPDPEQIVTVTLRLPAELHARLKDRAEAVDRSLNWLIVNLAQVFFDGEDARATNAPPWPEPDSGGRALFGVTLRWYMRHYAELTTERIDAALSRMTRALRDQGADDIITVDGPWQETPMDWRPPSDQPLYGNDVVVVDRYPQPGGPGYVVTMGSANTPSHTGPDDLP